MATVLQTYQERRTALEAEGLTAEQMWAFQELLHRISVLEALQQFCKTAPVSTKSKALSAHYRMVDAYIHSIAIERSFELCETDKEKRATAFDNLGLLIVDYRKQMSSFKPDTPETYKTKISGIIRAVLPAWITYRNQIIQL